MIFCANPASQFYSYQEEIEKAVLKVLRSDRYILGSEVSSLEAEFANFIGANFAVGVANGTDALELAIRSLEIKPGDEIITVSHTAVATVAAIEAAGAVPVLVDVDPFFYTLDSNQLGEVLTPKTKAIIAVHLYGQSSDLDAINEFCIKHNLYLIEDVSQAHGSKLKGKRLGGIGNIGCFSCYPTKNLGAIGDAGLIATNEPRLAQNIKMLREYGWKNRYISDFAGRNSRLDEIQAAILRVKLRHLDSDNDKRKELASLYSRQLTGKWLNLPKIRENSEHVFHLYVVRTKYRNELMSYLQEINIQTTVHYPLPIHLQPAYKNRIQTASVMSVTERLSQEVLSLPIYPEFQTKHLDEVVKAINNFAIKNKISD